MTGKQKPFVVDLTNCDREPIHISGAVQPHGVLLAVHGRDLEVAQASENVVQLLETPLEAVLGRPLANVIGLDPAEKIRSALQGEKWRDLNPLSLQIKKARFDAVVHVHAGASIVELEPALALPADTMHLPLRAPLEGVQRARTLPELCERIVQEVRRLTRFERVIVYRFDEGEHGYVAAESKQPELEPYLGLHYPASDIPRQARELYLKNWLRIIPDARYTPARIVPTMRPETGRPLDLTYSVLRSVSPIHLEYMANMGVRSAMSISLVVRGNLWGLISCANHTRPHFVPYPLRAACEILGRLMSLQIAGLEDVSAAAVRAARRGVQQVLERRMRDCPIDQNILTALFSRGQELAGLLKAEGAATVSPEGVVSCGRAPSGEQIEQLARWLDERGDAGLFATNSLAALWPHAKEFSDVASGVLAFELPVKRRLLWFRPELVETVSWGGDPRKPVEAGSNDRLRPRRSFELWKEEVRLRSQAWSTSDIETAEDLRRSALEIDLTRQLAREQRAVQARDDLVAIVSHDLKNPLHVIQMQTTLLRHLHQDDETSRRLRWSAERIQRAIDRMNALIGDLLDLAKIESGRFSLDPRPESLEEILRESLGTLSPLAEAKGIQIVDDIGEMPCATVDRERVFQVLSNLLGNSIKFTPEGGTITVRTRKIGPECEVTVADTGPGMIAEQLAHVFDRYWQARRTSREGTGLGLYIAKGIVEAHGGRIWADSSPGAGTRITFTLPSC